MALPSLRPTDRAVQVPSLAALRVSSSETVPVAPTSVPLLAPPLARLTVVPAQRNKSVDAARRIARIQWINVVAKTRTTGERQAYDVQIYLDTSSGAVLTSPLGPPPSPPLLPMLLIRPESPATEPDRWVTRDFHQFQKLRDALVYAVDDPHTSECRLCADYFAMLTFSTVRPAFDVWALLPSKTKVKVLHNLMHRAVNQYRKNRSAPVDSRRICSGERNLVRLLDAFLFVGHHDEDDGSHVLDQ